VFFLRVRKYFCFIEDANLQKMGVRYSLKLLELQAPERIGFIGLGF